jgi:hypothetical protein
MLTYDGDESCLGQIKRCLNDWDNVRSIAEHARTQICETYSKARQWALFEAIVAGL